jgi:hypothetical protein
MPGINDSSNTVLQQQSSNESVRLTTSLSAWNACIVLTLVSHLGITNGQVAQQSVISAISAISAIACTAESDCVKKLFQGLPCFHLYRANVISIHDLRWKIQG